MRYRDKDYLRTADDMLFNVTGYEHPADAVYASLKYVGGQKWVEGYAAARQFLKTHSPRCVADYIQVPLRAIVQSYCPRRRWKMLSAGPQQGLLAEAYRLGMRVAQRLGIPLNQLGVTDSLLWGSGHDASDIDLVVYGTRQVARLLQGAVRLFEDADFSRPSPTRMRAPYGRKVPRWSALLARKQHLGNFCGTPFSLRAVKEWSEVKPIGVSRGGPRSQVDFQVDDVEESLYFPAIYRDANGGCLIDYTVVYEGVLRVGDRFRGVCEVAETATGQPAFIVLPDQLSTYVIGTTRVFEP